VFELVCTVVSGDDRRERGQQQKIVGREPAHCECE
jgi:hypothetical protein